MKFLGLFFNREREASQVFEGIKAEYEATKVGVAAQHVAHSKQLSKGLAVQLCTVIRRGLPWQGRVCPGTGEYV